MPELPEIEVIKNKLKTLILNDPIKYAYITPRILAYPKIPSEKLPIPENTTISDISSKGKYLIFELSDKSKIILHLRISGRISLEHYNSTAFILTFKNAPDISVIDPNLYARIWYITANDNINTACPEITKLGIEPFDNDFNAKYLKSVIANRRCGIKTILTNQKIIAGIGNSYADEILFRAKISPQRKCKDISDTDIKKLAEIIPEYLRSIIDYDNIVVDHYLHSEMMEFNENYDFRVHNKSICKCGTNICMEKTNNRNTFWCPNCQT